MNYTALAYTAGVVWLLWCAIWGLTRTPKHGKHRTPPADAVHHQGGYLSPASNWKPEDLPDMPPPIVDTGPDTETWPAPRHTHRDPTTGRYTRREQ